MKSVLLAFLLAAVAVTTPTPFQISKEELAKISPEEIAKTKAHRYALETELNLLSAKQAENLDQAIAAANAAGESLKVYEDKVEKLALENIANYKAKLEAEKTVAEKDAAILRRNIALVGLGLVILVGGFLWLKGFLPFL